MKPIFKKRLLVLLCLSTLTQTSYAIDDLIISEYVEGSSYNKAIELFNGTSGDIDLSGYSLEYYFNGNNSAGRTIDLTGAVSQDEVFVVAQDRATPPLRDLAAQTDTSTSWFNGDDAVVLLKDGVIIDSIGQVGSDPGSEWGTGDTSTKDNTLRRINCIADVNVTDNFDPSSNWSGFPKDTFDGIGFHSCDQVVTGPQPIKFVKLHDIQGSGDVSPLEGQQVTVEAIVTADFQDSSELKGFFIQEEDADIDNSALTSEGIFVYESFADVKVGDLVRVTGTVDEYYNMTQLKNVSVEIVGQSSNLPSQSSITLPLASTGFIERYEGMRVTMPQSLTVTENYNLGRYGEFWLSSGGRLYTPTNVVSPGEDAIALQTENDLNRILVDDYSTYQNPDPIIHPTPELTSYNTLRSGYTASNVTGVISFAFGSYRIQPTTEIQFSDVNNPRTLTPEIVGGSLKVASFNVLNYFNGDGLGGGFPTSRGADSITEFERQRIKIINAIIAMDVDILGLMEIENDGYTENSAIADLVKGLNEQLGADTYAFIDPGMSKIGTDEIAVGLIYKTDKVRPSKDAQVLDSTIDPDFIDTKNRPALAQTFVEKSTNGILTVVVNHLKSKGSDCDSLNDPDVNDGQGNCNVTRTKAANALVNWLNQDPTNSQDSDFLIIGDLNAYAMEDPITTIKSAGYRDLIKQFNTENTGYSYVFYGQAGYLDHALSSESLTEQVSGVTEWHINADEPKVLDYNTEYKSDNQVYTLYNEEPYRASDHDPVIVGLNLAASARYVSVAGLESKKEWTGRGMSQRKVSVTIRIENDLGAPVENALINGVWSNKRGEKQSSCVTDSQGTCTVSIKTRQKVHPVKFVVESIEHSKLEYDASSNTQEALNIVLKPNFLHFFINFWSSFWR